MRLTRLHIDGFGLLVNQEWDFGPGINVIFGPNEAGKSTLQQAILALLFGFYSGNRTAASERRLHEQFRPWHTAAYGGKLYVQLDNQESYLVTRRFDLSEPETHVFNTRTGQDITDRFLQKRRGYVNFMEETVGISRPVFEAIACFKQGELTRLARQEAEQITDSIIRFVDSGSPDTSVRIALDRLSRAIRKIGTDRSRTSPLSQLRAAIDEAESLLEQRKSLAQSLEGDYLKVDHLKRQIRNLQQRESEIETDIRRSEMLSLQNLLKRLDEIEARKKDLEAELENLKGASRISLPNRDLVIKLMEERKLLRQERQKYYETLRHLHEERHKTRQDLDGLPPDPEFWTQADVQHFVELKHRWERISERAGDIQRHRDRLKSQLDAIGIDETVEARLKALSYEELEEQEERARELEHQQEELEAELEDISARRRNFNYGRIAIGSVLLFSFLVALVSQLVATDPAYGHLTQQLMNLLKYLATPLALFWLVFEYIFQRVMRLAQENVDYRMQLLRMQEQEQRAFLEPFGVSRLDDLKELRRKYQEIYQLNHQEMAQIQELKEVEEGLRPWLLAFRFNRLSGETLQRIHEMVRQGQQLRHYLDELNQRIGDLETELAERDQRIHQIHDQLQSIFMAANCWTGNLEQDAARFFQTMEKSQKYDALMQEWDQLNTLEQELLAGRTVEQLRERLDELEQVVEGEPATMNLPPQKELEKLLEEIQNQRQQLQIELAGVQERIAEREARLPELSEIEENLAQYQRELEQLTRTRQALELAYETLSEVARETHQDFAPQLAAAVSRQLGRLTGGRYQEVFIDTEDFSVRVSHEGVQSLIPVEQLSYGTREQIYLLMRLALSRYFSRGGEKLPIFLDDPLVHADNERQYAMLEMLVRIASQHQMFYFTKDESVVNTLLDLGEDYRLITLERAGESIPYRWAAGNSRQIIWPKRHISEINDLGDE